MKKVVVAIIILALILVSGVLETVWVHKIFGELDQKLTTLESALLDKSPTCQQQVKQLSAWWEDRRKYLELISYSPDLRAFSVALAEADGSIMCGDFDNALSKCQSLIVMASNIHRILDFNIEDII